MIDSLILNQILAAAPVFLLLAVRALALIETAPLLSSDSVPRVAKIALAGFAAFCVLPQAASQSGWESLPGISGAPFGLGFLLLIGGEAVIGIILGFFITIIFAAFSTAGQFFSLQMGFGASETFDPLAQIENPLIGQFLNLVAMLVFLVSGGFRDLFLAGFWHSVQSLSVPELAAGREKIAMLMASGLSHLFLDALMISMPILGTLFLVSLTTGLISKAAPQINILSEGFPLSISVAFVLILATLPFMVEGFNRIIGAGFRDLEGLFISVGGGIRE
ncbi:MAG: flagellar biosynthetic protein FliR [Spirochaetaceae bacterium]|jgi:flagellar biosynthetic protein FliR|nr:flagellar biosynthetic protein FliR [Spirochaetaceae bacterium]